MQGDLAHRAETFMSECWINSVFSFILLMLLAILISRALQREISPTIHTDKTFNSAKCSLLSSLLFFCIYFLFILIFFP